MKTSLQISGSFPCYSVSSGERVLAQFKYERQAKEWAARYTIWRDPLTYWTIGGIILSVVFGCYAISTLMSWGAL